LNVRWIAFLLWLLAVPALAEEGSSAAQANNPLANMTAFNIQNYYIGDVTGTDEDANQAWLRFAKPFSVKDTGLPCRSTPSRSARTAVTRPDSVI